MPTYGEPKNQGPFRRRARAFPRVPISPNPGVATFPGTYDRAPAVHIEGFRRAAPTPGTATFPGTYEGRPVLGRPDPRFHGTPTTGPKAPDVIDGRAPQPDPYAPLTDQQLLERARGQISAQIDPVIQQITETINRRASAGSDAIAALTRQLAGAVGGYQQAAQSIYTGAQGSQAAVDAALAQQLTGGGQQLASQLADTLRAAGQNTAPADTVAQAAQGAGGALAAQGSAGLSALIQQGALEQTYGAKLPGIANLTGLQAGRELQGQLNAELADQTGRLTAQVPGLTQSILNDLRQNELAKSDRRYQRTKDQRSFDESVRQFNVKRQDQQQAAAAKAGLPVGSTGTGAKYLVNAAGQVIGLNPNYQPPSEKPLSASEWRSKMKLAIGAGGWDAKTGRVTPELRQMIIDATRSPEHPNGIDPGLVVKRDDLVRAGLLPKVAAKKTDAKLGPNVTKTQAAKSKVMLDGYGRVYHDPKTGATIPFTPVTTGAGTDPAKARTAAESKANSLALGIIQTGAKKVPRYEQRPKTNDFGGTVVGPDGKPVMERAPVGERFGQDYYSTLHQAEAAVHDVLKAAGYTDAEIIRFVQKRINTFYKPGQAGRPLPGLKDKPDPVDRKPFPTSKPKPRRKTGGFPTPSIDLG